MLLMIRDLGITTQNMFALTEYQNSFSNPQNANETMPLWGSVIDMGGQTKLKLHQSSRATGQFGHSPHHADHDRQRGQPTWNQPQSTNDSIQLAAAHYLNLSRLLTVRTTASSSSI